MEICTDECNLNTHQAKFHNIWYSEMIFCFSVLSSDIMSGLQNKQVW